MNRNKITTPDNTQPARSPKTAGGGGPWREFFDAFRPSDKFPAEREQPPMQKRDFEQ
ncbi:MAG: AbrB/MazE/SpoVT family DNA-binding domain-containing protein [Rhodospirillales bacterium]